MPRHPRVNLRAVLAPLSVALGLAIGCGTSSSGPGPGAGAGDTFDRPGPDGGASGSGSGGLASSGSSGSSGGGSGAFMTGDAGSEVALAPTCTAAGQCVSSCAGGTPTTIAGTVYDPAGNNALYGVVVFVPSTTPAPFPAGASCTSCDTLYTGEPIAYAVTDASGHFAISGRAGRRGHPAGGADRQVAEADHGSQRHGLRDDDGGGQGGADAAEPDGGRHPRDRDRHRRSRLARVPAPPGRAG